MGLQYIYSGKEDNIYPQIVCDVCGKPIALSSGNVVWEAPPESWTSGDCAVNHVFFTHKECDYTLRTWLQQQEAMHTYWDELRLFPIHLMYNNGMKPAAMAAWEMRKPVEVTEPRDRTGLSLRFSILKRDKYRCQLCGRGAIDGVVLEIDHKVARANGGTDTPTNLWTLCFDCNRGKSDEYL